MEPPSTDCVTLGTSCARHSIILRGLVMPAYWPVLEARLLGRVGWEAESIYREEEKGVFELHVGKHLKPKQSKQK